MTIESTVLHQTTVVPLAQNMVTIASGKGGVGKTWLSITLSHALANAGSRVLLFDGDLGLANVDIQIGLMPERDLGGVIGGNSSLGEVILEFQDGGFDIIAGKSGSGTLASLSRVRLMSLREELSALSDRYDVVVLDLGSGLNPDVTMMTEHRGMTLVTVTDEPTSLTDAYALIKVTNMQNPKADMRIAVNMANSLEEGKRTYGTLRRACENFLKISPPLAGIVRRDERVKDAIRNQVAFLTRYPTTDTAEDVAEIAKYILSKE